jgi:DNA polymerase-3 subunit epsilon
VNQYAAIDGTSLSVVHASSEEVAAHDAIMDLLDKKSDGAIWRR